MSGDYLFGLGSYTLRPQAVADLDTLLPAIRPSSGEILVYGYTDGLGTVASNGVLSQERADAVKAWLVSNGIAAGRILAQGKGEETSAVDPAHRRVEIILK